MQCIQAFSRSRLDNIPVYFIAASGYRGTEPDRTPAKGTEMDTRKLKYFLAVVDYGGFSRAAEQLFIAQPSLSQSVSSLERDLGVSLFHRIGRTAVLSNAGRELLGPARQVMRDLESAVAAVQSVKSLTSGRLELITMPSPGIEPMATLSSAYSASFPGVQLDIRAAFTPEEVIDSVRSGQTEIGLAGTPSTIQVAGMNVLQLKPQPFILIVNPHADVFEPDQTDIELHTLAGHRMIASQRGSQMRRLIDEAVSAGAAIHIAAQVAHRTSILPLVSAGIGHAVMPAAWKSTARRSGLRTLMITPREYLHVALLSRTEHLTPAAQGFLQVAETIGDLYA